MDLKTREEHGTTVIVVDGRVDTVTAPGFEAYCITAIDAGARRLVLDCARLAYISSAGLSSVLAVAKHGLHAGGTLVVCGLAGMVKEIFAISGFDTIVAVRAGVDEAVADV
jgi:anti-anti-sigma factor